MRGLRKIGREHDCHRGLRPEDLWGLIRGTPGHRLAEATRCGQQKKYRSLHHVNSLNRREADVYTVVARGRDHPDTQSVLAGFRKCHITVTAWAALDTPPTLTTRGWAPAGAFGGTVTMSRVTPTMEDFPMKVKPAGTPPTVTFTGNNGFGI